MCDLDVVTNEKNEKYNFKCPYILDHPYKDHGKSPIGLS